MDQQEVSCQDCPFGGRKIKGRGNPNSPFVLVGEGPGHEELQANIPFAGQSGKLLHSIIPEDSDYYILNSMECFPAGKTPKRIKQGIISCRGRLVHELRKVPRKLIVAMGGVAAQSLTGNFDLKITQERGKLINSDLAELGILLTIHPAFILRGGGQLKDLKADLEYAMGLLGGEDSSKWREPTHLVWGRDNPTKCEALRQKLLTCNDLSDDIETSGFDFTSDQILSVGFSSSANPTEVLIFPGDQLEAARGLIEHPGMCWHNGKFDIKFLRRRGFKARVDDDTMLLSYCLNENHGVHDLEQLMANELRAPDYKDMLKPWVPKKTDSYSNVPPDVLYKYHAIDLCGTAMVRPILRKRVAQDPVLEKLYTKVLIPASEMLARVEDRGMLIDPERVEENKEYLTKELTKANAQLNEVAGWQINPNSHKQVAVLLYDQLKFRKTRYGRSTAKEVVALLPQDHPAIKALKICRRMGKMLSTYTDSFLALRDSEGLIHSTYLLHGTPTGRLASRNPNLQNIPREPRFKGMIIARPGRRLLEADLNQAELRSLACLSEDDFLCAIYRDNTRSLHKEVAKDRYGLNYTPDQYIRAKAVNFGIVYGRSAFSIAEEFSCSKREAQEDIDAWWERSPKARDFVNKCRNAPLRGQVIVTPFGRKRRFGVVSRENLIAVQNAAANFPHQSIASDINLTAAIEAQPYLEAIDCYIINLVHDSIIVDIPDNNAVEEQASRILQDMMQSKPIEWGITTVPFLADVKSSYRWGDKE